MDKIRTPVLSATGQSRCFDTHGRPVFCPGSGQDGEFQLGAALPSTERFSVQGPTVLDHLTGLTFLRDAAPFTFPLSWKETRQAMTELNARAPGGHDDWRLPTRRELASLVHFGSANPALPSTHPFENVFSGKYWTATDWAGNPDLAWFVQFSGGREFFEEKSRPCMAWPVRGNWPGSENLKAKNRFKIANDVVFDPATGLTWAPKADLCGPCDWDGALQAVAMIRQANHLGRNDWRLPNIRELLSLVDTDRHSPALPSVHPFTELGEVYWSSTSSSMEPNWAMCLYLNKGALGVGVKTESDFLAWAVAGPGERG
ncbi:MAG: DUF1566 domain-containing protein [Deltaproteobacteria bacterium]|nr:DUF1566 domain-containing protein [Deltaproteobacteria bacterium]